MKSPNFELLEWESEYFDKKIFTFEGFPLFSSLNPDEYDLVCKKIKSSDYSVIEYLNHNGFDYVEGEVTLHKKLIKNIQDDSIFTFNIARASDIKQLREICYGMYKYSRFREPWFSELQKNQFYNLWLENAVNGTFDDVCLLVKQGVDIKGFVTLKELGGSIKIGLIGVAHQFQGIGVGKELLKLSESYSLKFNVDKLMVSTQLSNLNAIKLYSTSGFTIDSIHYWFYKNKANKL